ncbi:glucuronyl esterase domain-containing protein [Maribellus mangrovi]|uniref:glucuronyl esterase domain-containing protein n=1 Tax=Maribellus mangrovi TaxID=3133146 RepID=UPI0030EEAE38
MKPKLFIPFLLLVSIFGSHKSTAQDAVEKVAGIPVNYDEALVKPYTLPDPLTLSKGQKVSDAETWYSSRRPEIVRLFEEHQFGKTPDRSEVSFKVFDTGTPAFNGQAIRKQVTLYFTNDTSDHKADLLIYLPSDSKGPVPLFLNISFVPNQVTVDDPGVRKGMMWGREGKKVPVPNGMTFGRMDAEKFIAAGYGFATIYYGDIEPDFAKGISYGIRGYHLKKETKYPAPDEWGAIAAWAWGLSCTMDYMETDSGIDSKKVALFGISRLGKTVLWAGAHDPRFGMVIASCSGEGGAAISRREYGETIKHMTDSTRFFYQFCGNRAKYGDDPGQSPVDAHMLVALMAPRPLLLQTGTADNWSDPKGEFLAAVAAEPVYELLGKKGLGTETMPAANVPILHDLGYFMHEGGHGAMPGDYHIFLQFMDMHFSKTK